MNFVLVYDFGVLSVVKLLSKRWWIPIGARPEGPRTEVGFPTADQGFSSIQDTLALMAFRPINSVWCLDSTQRSDDPTKKVQDLNCEVQDLLLEVVDLK